MYSLNNILKYQLSFHLGLNKIIIRIYAREHLCFLTMPSSRDEI